MKKERRLLMRFLFLLLIIGTISCAGTKGIVNAEPQGDLSQFQRPIPAQAPLASVVPPVAAAGETTQSETGPSPDSMQAQARIPRIQQGPIGVPPAPSTPTQPQVAQPPPAPGSAPAAAPGPAPAPAPAPTPMPSAQPVPAPLAPPPRPAAPPAAASPEVRKGSGFVFNFDNADLYEVIRVMGEILKINYMIDPKVKGVVNIHTSGQISAEDVFPIFQSILHLNGATLMKKGNLYEIIPLGDAKKLYTVMPSPAEMGKLSPDERYVIQILPLKYIPVAEASKIIKPFLSDGADIVEHPPNNILLIGDVAPNVRKCVDLINLFDIDLFVNLKVRIYPIANADVTEVAKEMERIFSSFEISVKSGRGVGITFTPIARINSLLVVSSIPNIMEKVEGWLRQLDKTPAEEAKLGVFVYYVQNAKAKDLADVLKQVFAPPKDKKDFKDKVTTPTPTPPAATPPTRGIRPTTPGGTTPTPPSTSEEGGLPAGEISIVVDETNNALVIRALARDYKSILDAIKKLDLYPKQVLIEVLLAEITLDDDTKFGVEWSKFIKTYGNYTQEIIVGATPPTTIPAVTSGIRYSIVDAAGKFAAALSAAANDNRLNVISSPNLLASNNKEAKIQIGLSQPVLSSTYTTTATAATNVVEGTIEYKDVGILLTVTPRISDGGLVTMEVSIEDSKVDYTSLGNLTNIPVFRKKTAKTVLSVSEGQMIVIGGLIEDQKNVTKSGIPIISRIPILGALFGTQNYIDRKTEFMVLMTPHVIADAVQSRSVTEEFREKVEGIKRDLEQRGLKTKKYTQ